MNTDNNRVFQLLSAGESPSGWGFPPPAASRPDGLSGLRRQLMWMEDEDGRAQLVRWYHAMIRGFDPVWRAVSGPEEGYLPSMCHRQAVESTTATICRDPSIGVLALGWSPGPETSSLTGQLTTAGNRAVRLKIGGLTHELQSAVHPDSGRTSVSWPPFMDCVAGLATPTDGTHTVFFRPWRFNAKGVAASIGENAIQELERSGMLPLFLALPRPEFKLAVAWQAVDRIETWT